MKCPLLVAIVDGCGSARDSLRQTVRDLGYDTQVYGSSEAYLLSGMSPGCLIIGDALPGMNSRSLIERLCGTGRLVPFFLLGEQSPCGEASEFQVEATPDLGEVLGGGIGEVIRTAFRMSAAASQTTALESLPPADLLGPVEMLKRRLVRSWQPAESLGVA